MLIFQRKYLTGALHGIIWLCLFLYPFLFHYIPLDDVRAVSRIGLLLLLLMSFFYLNTGVLIPRVLGRKRILLYLLLIALLIFVISVSTGYIQVLLNPEYDQKPGVVRRAINTALITSLLTWVISTFLQLTAEWFRNQQQMRVVENEKLNAELNFLRSQVNPHFLFNALNNIYSLSVRNSKDTGPAILKLSDLVRFMLYETASDFVELEKELLYIESYIELQKLGLGGKVEVHCERSGDASGKKIRPMLLIPLVENVFKHGITYRGEPVIRIRMLISDSRFDLYTENPLPEKNTGHHAGIGLENLRKRLELLYPGNYSLEVSKENSQFRTHLQILIA